MNEKEKWELAYDKGGKCCGYMTSNMIEIFNSILRGVWSLPVTMIVYFTFYKLMHRWSKYTTLTMWSHRTFI
jgi:ABC-type arginine transport system permease subunit